MKFIHNKQIGKHASHHRHGGEIVFIYEFRVLVSTVCGGVKCSFGAV